MNSANKKDSHKYEGERELAAIMFTDMVGYSTLSQRNEDLAIELLTLHREILRPIFKKHQGKEIENIGDAFFVEFRSTVSAASCAIEIQKTLYERNLNCNDERKILLRIGLHVGDVFHIGKHVHGDGVNIAARLEPLSIPGGICLSEDIARQVNNKIEYDVQHIGVKKLKNIDIPMNIYSIKLPWLGKQRDISDNKFKSYLSGNKYSAVIILIAIIVMAFALWQSLFISPTGNKNNRLAVLPLLNIGSNDEDEYFADGMTEELISNLARIKKLSVIARSSVMKYKNSLHNIEEIGSELNVDVVLEGSVRKVDEHARINVHLIDVDSQENLWNEEYNREIKDIFSVQSEIALKIAEELEIKLLNAEKKQVEKFVSKNNVAHKLYLLGKFYFNKKTNESISTALKYFQSAISEDTLYALAYVGAADCYTLIGGAGYGTLSRDDVIQNANKLVQKALEIDESLAEAYNALAYIKFRLEWDWNGAEENFLHAIELKPGFAEVYEKYALFLALHKRFDEAMVYMSKAYNLNPLSMSVMTGIGRIHHFAGRNEKAINQYNKILKMNPDYAEAVFARGLSYCVQKRFDLAIAELKRASKLSNERLMVVTALGLTYARANQIDSTKLIYNKLVERSKSTHVSPFYFALLEWTFADKEKAIDKFYSAYKDHFGITVYLNASPLYDQTLRKEPRFINLLEQMRFEL